MVEGKELIRKEIGNIGYELFSITTNKLEIDTSNMEMMTLNYSMNSKDDERRPSEFYNILDRLENRVNLIIYDYSVTKYSKEVTYEDIYKMIKSLKINGIIKLPIEISGGGVSIGYIDDKKTKEINYYGKGTEDYSYNIVIENREVSAGEINGLRYKVYKRLNELKDNKLEMIGILYRTIGFEVTIYKNSDYVGVHVPKYGKSSMMVGKSDYIIMKKKNTINKEEMYENIYKSCKEKYPRDWEAICYKNTPEIKKILEMKARTTSRKTSGTIRVENETEVNKLIKEYMETVEKLEINIEKMNQSNNEREISNIQYQNYDSYEKLSMLPSQLVNLLENKNNELKNQIEKHNILRQIMNRTLEQNSEYDKLTIELKNRIPIKELLVEYINTINMREEIGYKRKKLSILVNIIDSKLRIDRENQELYEQFKIHNALRQKAYKTPAEVENYALAETILKSLQSGGYYSKYKKYKSLYLNLKNIK